MKLWKLSFLSDYIQYFQPRISFDLSGDYETTTTETEQTLDKTVEALTEAEQTAEEITAIEEQTVAEQLATQESVQETQETATTETLQTTEQITSLLGEDIQRLLENIVTGLGEDLGPNVEADFMSALLGERAVTAEQDILNQIGPIMQERQRQGERELLRLETRLAQMAGGSLANTGVVAATAEGRAALESQLMEQEAKLRLAARETQTQEMQAAFQSLIADTGELRNIEGMTSLLSILRGAEQVTTGVATAATEEERSAASLIEEIMQSTTTEQATTDILKTLLEQLTQQTTEETEALTTGLTTSETASAGFELGL